jgi:hypothetical protein
MKRALAELLILLAINLFASLTHAAPPQLVLDHTLTGYSKSATAVTLDYSLHVTNPGNTPLADLSLSLVPIPPLVAKGKTVSVGYLGPHQSAYVSLQIVTPALLDEDRFARIPIFWAGKYQDSEGKLVQFPAKSRPGGAK